MNRVRILLLPITILFILSAFNLQPIAIQIQDEDPLDETETIREATELVPLDDAALLKVGPTHSCLITNSGIAKCWGFNSSGQLGDGTTDPQSVPVEVLGLGERVTDLALGEEHTCAVLSSGGVKCWGDNYQGQLGDGTTVDRIAPVDVLGLNAQVTDIAAGEWHTCALTDSGGVKCWGYNNWDILGDGTGEDSAAPVDVLGLTNGVRAISAGMHHTCVIIAQGGVKCWGQTGLLGVQSFENLPLDVPGLDRGVTLLDAGPLHTCAAKGSQIFCWGANFNGQLGDGNKNQVQFTPVQVQDLSGNITALSVGGLHTCAQVDEVVQCWGENSFGQLGTGTAESSLFPIATIDLGKTVIGLGAGYVHTCALTDDGEVACWGLHRQGLLGDGYSDSSQSKPVDVVELKDARSIFAGQAGTCAVLGDESIKCWGFQSAMSIGAYLTSGWHLNIGVPQDVSGLSGAFASVTIGEGHTCALTTQGAVKCWGSNYQGQLGDGTMESQEEPVDVLGLRDGVHIVTGGDHTCSLNSQGQVLCWGNNYYGQLGDGTTEDRDVPVQVAGLEGGVVDIAAASDHTCALESNGEVTCWGNGYPGKLGDGTLDDHYTPTTVVGLPTSAIDVAAGEEHTCAALSDGSVWCWGSNETGQLGDGSEDDSRIPIQVEGLGDVSTISAGYGHTCALTQSGRVTCWGLNTFSQLGTSGDEFLRSPIEVDGLTRDIRAISAGSMHTCALTNSGEVKCWGSGEEGQLGNDSLVQITPVWAMKEIPRTTTAFREPGPLVPELTTYIPTPLDISTEPAVVGTNLILAALLMIPFAIAAELLTNMMTGFEPVINKLLPGEKLSILKVRLLTKLGEGIKKTQVADTLRLITIALFYGVVFSLLDQTWKPFTLTGVVLLTEMTLAYGIVGIADDVMQWRKARRWEVSAKLTLRASSIFLAMASTATSRLLNLIPGLMFGTPEALEIDRSSLDNDKRNGLMRISAITLGAIGLGLWIPTIFTGWAQNQEISSKLLDAIGGLEGFLLVVFAVSLENIFIQLLGFSGSLGEGLRRRNRWIWIASLVGVTFAFYHTLINPHGELATAFEHGNVRFFITVVVIFVSSVFTIWAYSKSHARLSAALGKLRISFPKPSLRLPRIKPAEPKPSQIARVVEELPPPKPELIPEVELAPSCAQCGQTFIWSESFRQQNTPGSDPYNPPGTACFRPRTFCPHCGDLVAEWHLTPQQDFDEWTWFGAHGTQNADVPLPPSPIVYGGGIDIPIRFTSYYDEQCVDVGAIKEFLEGEVDAVPDEGERPWQHAYDRSFTLFQEGDLPRALMRFEQAIKLGLPKQNQALIHGAFGEHYLLQEKDLQSAQKHCAQSVELEPSSYWKSHFYLSLMYENQGDVEKAEIAYRNARRFAQTTWFTPEAEQLAREAFIDQPPETATVVETALPTVEILDMEEPIKIPDSKKCPMCAEQIKLEAKICRFCRTGFKVEIKGYCCECHTVVLLDVKDRCRKCGSEVIDRHVDSLWLGEASRSPRQKQTSTPVAPLEIQEPEKSIDERRGWLARIFSNTKWFYIIGAVIILSVGTFFVFQALEDHSEQPVMAIPSADTPASPTRPPPPTSSPRPTPMTTAAPDAPSQTQHAEHPWILNFVVPILASIEGNAPIFEDDFSTTKVEWGELPAGVEIADGSLTIETKDDVDVNHGGDHISALNFVISFDFTVVNGGGNPSIGFVFRQGEGQYYSVEYLPDSGSNPTQAEWVLYKGQETINSDTIGNYKPDANNTLLIVARNDEFAFLVNDEPLGFFHDEDFKGTANSIHIDVGQGDLRVLIDNLKFWNLDDLSNN